MKQPIDITVENLPLTCPMSQVSLWDAHPKVTLAFDEHNLASCPYCGARYKLTGELPKGQH
jgi:uncharacterized Zn-finger protein